MVFQDILAPFLSRKKYTWDVSTRFAHSLRIVFARAGHSLRLSRKSRGEPSHAGCSWLKEPSLLLREKNSHALARLGIDDLLTCMTLQRHAFCGSSQGVRVGGSR